MSDSCGTVCLLLFPIKYYILSRCLHEHAHSQSDQILCQREIPVQPGSHRLLSQKCAALRYMVFVRTAPQVWSALNISVGFHVHKPAGRAEDWYPLLTYQKEQSTLPPPGRLYPYDFIAKLIWMALAS